MARLQAMGIVVEDTLSFTRRRSRDAEPLRIQINGRVRCSQGVTLEVDKWLRVRRRHDNRLEVRGFSYSYHAWIEDSRRDLLRYDNAHGELHRHFFDGEGIEVAVTPIDLDQLPTLDAVIEEAVRLARER